MDPSDGRAPQRRSHPRIPLRIRVRLEFKDLRYFLSEFAFNLSAEGMFVKTETPRPPGEQIVFEGQLTKRGPKIAGRGEVQWVRKESEGASRPPGMGIRFHEIDDESRELLARLGELYLDEGAEAMEAALEEAAEEWEKRALEEDSTASIPRPDEVEPSEQDDLTPPPPPAPPAAPEPAPTVETAAPDPPTADEEEDLPPVPERRARAGDGGDIPTKVEIRSGPIPAGDGAEDTPPPTEEIDTGSVELGAVADEQREAGRNPPPTEEMDTETAGTRFISLESLPEIEEEASPGEPVPAAAAGPLSAVGDEASEPEATVSLETGGHGGEPASGVSETGPEGGSKRWLGPGALVVVIGVGSAVALWMLWSGDGETTVRPMSVERREGGSDAVAELPVAPTEIPGDPTVVEVETVPLESFSRIRDISFSAGEEELEVDITVDGFLPPGSYSSFRLEGDSPRQVVRIVGVGQGFEEREIEVGNELVHRIRTGFHPREGGNEVHVVFDLASGAVAIDSLETDGRSLTVRFVVGDDALPEAVEAPPTRPQIPSRER